MMNSEDGALVCVQCHLSDDRFLKLDGYARTLFIDTFLRYMVGFEIAWSRNFELISFFMDVSRSYDEPPLVLSRQTIWSHFYKEVEVVPRIPEDDPEKEEADEEALNEYFAENDRWFRDLEEDDPRCMLYAMRAFFTFLNPTSSIGTVILERDLADDRFLSLDLYGQQLVVAEFVNYVDDSEVNKGNKNVLKYLFSEAVTNDDPSSASKDAIAEAIRRIEAETAGERGQKGKYSLPYDIDELLSELDTYDSECILGVMRSIFAFLNPGRHG